MTIKRRSGMYRRTMRIALLTGCAFHVWSVPAFTEPLDCSGVLEVIPEADISYNEGEGYVQYGLSYDQDGYHWLGTAFEFLAPFTDNALLAGVEMADGTNLTLAVANNYRAMLIDSLVHETMEQPVETQTEAGKVVTFASSKGPSPALYGFHARVREEAIQVYRISAVSMDSDRVPREDQGVDAAVKLVKSCQNDET